MPDGCLELTGPARLPDLDRAAFGEVASLLAPERLDACLRRTARTAKSLLRDLDALTGSSAGFESIVDQVHQFGGSAGMFGFTELSRLGRSFEKAVRTGAPGIDPLARELGEAIAAACREIDRLL